MLLNGGKIYRVEDTILRIARCYRMNEIYSYVTPIGIFLSIQDFKHQCNTKLIRIFDRLIDHSKGRLVNDISRKTCEESVIINKT